MYGPLFLWELQLNLFMSVNFCMDNLQGALKTVHLHIPKSLFQQKREECTLPPPPLFRSLLLEQLQKKGGREWQLEADRLSPVGATHSRTA